MSGAELCQAVAAAVFRIQPRGLRIDDPRLSPVDEPSRRFLALVDELDAGDFTQLGPAQKAGNEVVRAWKRTVAGIPAARAS